METYNLSVATKKLYEAPLALFTTASLKDLLQVENDMTLFSIIRRLIRSGVIEKIERGKYRLVNSTTGDFELASFLYTPSYISFETALNFYGILSQFPYEVTSATTKKPVKKHIHEKIFSYTRVNRSLFWGYKKDKQALIAEPEKALLDQVYLSSKGLRNAPLDEYDLSRINKKRLREFTRMFPKTKPFYRLVLGLQNYLKP